MGEEKADDEREKAGTPADLAQGLWALVAAVFGGAAGALTLGPPTDVPALTTGLCVATAALAWLLAWIVGGRVGRRTSGRSFRARCFVTLVLAGVVAIGSVIGYVLARDRLTAMCAGERHIIGTELTDQADGVVRTRGYTTAEDLLMSAGCSAKDVWTAESLRWSAGILWSVFFLLAGGLVFPVIFLWHVLASSRSLRAR